MKQKNNICRITLATLDQLTYNEFALIGNINIHINKIKPFTFPGTSNQNP